MRRPPGMAVRHKLLPREGQPLVRHEHDPEGSVQALQPPQWPLQGHEREGSAMRLWGPDDADPRFPTESSRTQGMTHGRDTCVTDSSLGGHVQQQHRRQRDVWSSHSRSRVLHCPLLLSALDAATRDLGQRWHHPWRSAAHAEWGLTRGRISRPGHSCDGERSVPTA